MIVYMQDPKVGAAGKASSKTEQPNNCSSEAAAQHAQDTYLARLLASNISDDDGDIGYIDEQTSAAQEYLSNRTSSQHAAVTQELRAFLAKLSKILVSVSPIAFNAFFFFFLSSYICNQKNLLKLNLSLNFVFTLIINVMYICTCIG